MTSNPYPKERERSDADLRGLLDGYWNSLNDALGALAEDDVARLLELERAGRARHHVLLRLHQRYNAMRRARERHELLAAQPRAPNPGTTED